MKPEDQDFRSTIGLPTNVRVGPKIMFEDGVISERKDHYILTSRPDPGNKYKRIDLVMINPDKKSPVSAIEFSVIKHIDPDHLLSFSDSDRLETHWRVFKKPDALVDGHYQIPKAIYENVIPKPSYIKTEGEVPLGLTDFLESHKLGNETFGIHVPLEKLMQDGLLSKALFEKADNAALELASIAHATNVLNHSPDKQIRLLNPVLKILDKGLVNNPPVIGRSA